jgi:hypothetical protein
VPITAAELNVLVDADTKRAETGLRRVNQAVTSTGSFFRSAASTAVGFGAATIGVAAAAAAPQALADVLGFGLAVELENAEAALNAFTKDSSQTANILARLRQEADQTPFGFRELASAAQSLLPAAKASGNELFDLIKVAEVLSALNPAEGLAGAAFSLREAVSGDFVSVIDRFNLSRSTINRLKAEGVPALELISRALAEMGADQELVARQATTFTGRLSTFNDAVDSVRIEAGKPILSALTDELLRFTGILSGSQGDLQSMAANLGGNLAGGIRTFGQELGTVLTTAQNIQATHGLGLGDALGVAAELRIGELFGPGAQAGFNEFVATLRGIPDAVRGIGAAITATQADFKRLIIDLSTVPVVGDKFKDTAAGFRTDLGLAAPAEPTALDRVRQAAVASSPLLGAAIQQVDAISGLFGGGGAPVTTNINMGGVTITRTADAFEVLDILAGHEAAALATAGTAGLPGAD